MMMASATVANSRKPCEMDRAEGLPRATTCGRIKQGIEEGDVPSGPTPPRLPISTTILTGMALQAREGASRRSLLATVAQAMSLFPKPQKKKLAAAA